MSERENTGVDCSSSRLIFYSLKTVVKRNCVQSSYKYTAHV